MSELIRFLRVLDLGYTEVTDSGLLFHIEGLSNLEQLASSRGLTRVTDAGLSHLKGLDSSSSIDSLRYAD